MIGYKCRMLLAVVLFSLLLVPTSTEVTAQSNPTFQESWSWLKSKINEGHAVQSSWQGVFDLGRRRAGENNFRTGNAIRISDDLDSFTYKSIVDISMGAPDQANSCIFEFREYYYDYTSDYGEWTKRDYRVPMYDLVDIKYEKHDRDYGTDIYKITLRTSTRSIEVLNKEYTQLRDNRRTGTTGREAKTVTSYVNLYFYNPAWDMRDMTSRMTNAFNHLRTLCLSYRPKSNEPF